MNMIIGNTAKNFTIIVQKDTFVFCNLEPKNNSACYCSGNKKAAQIWISVKKKKKKNFD